MRSRMFKTTLSIVLLCMFVPVLAIGLTSGLLTQRSSRESFDRERTQQLTLVRNTCDLLLDECSFIYYQLIMDDNTLRAIDFGDAPLPLPYGQLQRIATLMDGMDLVAGSRPFMHSILLYAENPNGLLISSRYGLVRLHSDPDRGWYDTYLQNRTQALYAHPRTLERSGDVLTLYFSLQNNVQRQEGVMVFHYRLAEMIALLPQDDTDWMVLDESGALLFGAGTGAPPDEALRAEILAMTPGQSVFAQSLPDAVLYQVRSDAYGWRYVNITPRAMLSQTARSINLLLATVAALSLVTGVLIAVALTRIAARPLKRILSMIERMDQGDPLPPPQERQRDEYEVISYNLLENHLSRQRMAEQLAQRQLRLQEAQMYALQAQINPHFLYNTMEIINWRAIRALGEANSISHMITTLSGLLRYALERPSDPVPFQRELDHGTGYTELMTYRLGAVFRVEEHVTPQARAAPVPKLILQPLLENAVQHGIQQMEGEGVIAIDARVQGACLILTVKDNGAGMSPDLLAMLRRQLTTFDGLQYKHIGLFNVYQRMRLATEDRAEMTIDSVEGEGTRVTLVLPIMEGG